MVLVLFGPPGSGKGTQAQMLMRESGFEHISTGDILRNEIAAVTPLGQEIKDIIDQGGFISDDIILKVVSEALKKPLTESLIFDGFPRTLRQALEIDRLLALQQRQVDLVIDMVINANDLVSRITGRFSCVSCGAVYHDLTCRPSVEGVCDYCGGKEFKRRMDDTAEVALSRFQMHEQETLPVRDYYAGQGKLHQVDAAQAVEVVRGQIQALINEKKQLH